VIDKLEIIEQTKPEFSSKISKSSLVISPVAVKILTAVLTSLKHLQDKNNEHRKCDSLDAIFVSTWSALLE